MVFCSLDINDILQGAGVILALALCIGWIVRKVFFSKNKKGSCCSDEKYCNEDNGCHGCPLSDNCKKH